MERRHPVLGVLSGLCLGLGLAFLLFVYGVLPMTVLWFVLIVLGIGVLGWILARVTPARDDAGHEPDSPQPPTTSTDQPTAA